MTTVSPSQADIIGVLKTVLTAILPPNTPINQGQVNRVAEPSAPNFIVYNTIGRLRLSTNIDGSVDGTLAKPATADTTTSTQKTQVTVQIDAHGPLGADNIQIITTMLRSFFAAELIAATGIKGVSFLYTSEPRQAPFSNGANQYEYRWSADVVIQADQVVTTTAPALLPGFADTITTLPTPTRLIS